MKRRFVFSLLLCLIITACGAEATPASTQVPGSPTSNYFPLPVTTAKATVTSRPRVISPITPVPTRTLTSTPRPPGPPGSDPEQWKSWPVLPQTIDPSLQKVYERGQVLGND